MSPSDRTVTLSRLRQIAIGDNTYVLRSYIAGNAYDIADALQWSLEMVDTLIVDTPDSDLRQRAVELCDHTFVRTAGTPTAGEWGNAT